MSDRTDLLSDNTQQAPVHLLTCSDARADLRWALPHFFRPLSVLAARLSPSSSPSHAAPCSSRLAGVAEADAATSYTGSLGAVLVAATS